MNTIDKINYVYFDEGVLSWTPILSKQNHKEKNCGQHCVSMITHLPVDLVCSELKKNGSTNISDISGMLRWFGYDCDVNLTRFRKGMTLPDLCVAHVNHHWIVIFKEIVYDSCCGVFPLKYDSRRIKSFICVELPKV